MPMNLSNESELIQMAAAGKTKELQEFKEISEEVNFRGKCGLTALMLAAKGGHLDTCRFLLENGASIDMRTNHYLIRGKSAIMFAAEEGHFSVVEFLYQKGANITFLDTNLNSSLLLSARNGHLKIVQFLRETCLVPADDTTLNNYSALYLAAKGGYLDVVQYLLSPKGGFTIQDTLRQGSNALMAAASTGQVEVIRYLLSQGANIEKSYADADTAYKIAKRNSHLEAGKVLLAAEELMKVTRGISGNRSIAELLEAGASVHQRGKKGATPLHLAVMCHVDSAVKQLLEMGADIFARDDDELTPLQHTEKCSYFYYDFSLVTHHSRMSNILSTAYCLSHLIKHFEALKKPKEVEEYLERLQRIAGKTDKIKEKATIFFILGKVLKDHLKDPEKAYSAFMAVPKGAFDLYANAHTELMEMALSKQLPRFPEQAFGLEFMEPEERKEHKEEKEGKEEKEQRDGDEYLKQALRFGLEADEEPQTVQLRTRITNAFLGEFTLAQPFGDPCDPTAALMLLTAFKKEKQDHKALKEHVKMQETELQTLRLKVATLEGSSSSSDSRKRKAPEAEDPSAKRHCA